MNIIYRLNLELRGPAHELPEKLNQFIDDIATAREMVSDYTNEEIFIESTAYMTLVSLVLSHTVKGIDLAKGQGTYVGTLFSIPARSPVFIPLRERDDEGVSTFHIQYRMLK